LGEVYSPVLHWTSSLRQKAGLSPFTGNENEASTFTIKDQDAAHAFAHMLTRKGYPIPDKSIRAPVYHIEVVTTEGGHMSKFALEPSQVQKVSLRRYLRLRCCFPLLAILGALLLLTFI
jgi:hypothetical protein